MSTSTDDELLSIMQLSDSFFPTGSYSLSFGLETYSQLGLLKGVDAVKSLVLVFLEQLSTLDCVALRAAYRAARDDDSARIIAIDWKLASLKNVKEFYEASRRTGRALIRTVKEFEKSKLLARYARLVEARKVPGNYSVCLALACSSLNIAEENSVTMMLYSSAISMLGAAVRLGNLTHVQAQQVLASARPKIAILSKGSLDAEWHHMRAFSPSLDIMGMQHVYLASRMFSC